MMKKRMSVGNVILKIIGTSISILILILVVYALYRGGEYAYNFGYRVFTEEPVATIEKSEDKVVQIDKDMDAKEIGDLLEKKGLIRDANLFVVQLKISAYANEIKEGTYTLSTSMTAREMMQIMSADEEETETETEE